jgi:hypothetical protein
MTPPNLYRRPCSVRHGICPYRGSASNPVVPPTSNPNPIFLSPFRGTTSEALSLESTISFSSSSWNCLPPMDVHLHPDQSAEYQPTIFCHHQNRQAPAINNNTHDLTPNNSSTQHATLLKHDRHTLDAFSTPSEPVIPCEKIDDRHEKSCNHPILSPLRRPHTGSPFLPLPQLLSRGNEASHMSMQCIDD